MFIVVEANNLKTTNYHIIFSLLWLSFLSFGQQFRIEFSEVEKDFIRNHPKISFGYEPLWEPYELYSEGEYKGIVGEYVAILRRETGIHFEPLPNMTWQESIDGVMNGSIMMVPCCAITPERSKKLAFTRVYINDPMVIAVRKDYQFIGGLDDLAGKTVVLPEDYYTLEMMKYRNDDVHIISRPNINECLEALSFGEADAFIDNLGVISYYMSHKGFSNLRVAAPTGWKDNGIALATPKEYSVLRDIAQKVFDAIPQATHSEIRQKWISNDYGEGFFRKRFVYLTLLYGGIMLLIIVVFVIWTKTLKKQIRLRRTSEIQLMESLISIKKQDAEKKILLQEIHHRVKNNLQMVSSLLRLQADVVKNKKVNQYLLEAVNRIKTIALVHDKIYKSPDVSEVTIQTYLESLVDDILLNFNLNETVDREIICDQLDFNLDNIVPLGLMINELVTNSAKYAFPECENPKLVMRLKKIDGDWAQFDYWDNGTWLENEDSDNFGSYLIDIFTEQLEGKKELVRTKGKTHYIFSLRCNC